MDASHPGKAGFNGITSITGQLAKLVLQGGAPLSFFTGADDASGTLVYALGRNPLSGTRVVTFSETGFGSTSPAVQFRPVFTGNNITSVNLYDSGTVSGVSYVAGNNSYSSGGTLATELAKIVVTPSGGDWSTSNLYDAVPFGLIGYVGVSDAASLLTAINGSGASNTNQDTSYVLKYNGEGLSPSYNPVSGATTWDFTAIKQGKYSLWSYAYLSYKSTLSGTPRTFADALAANILTSVPTTSGVRLSQMAGYDGATTPITPGVQRASEGAVITR